ncbi:hypothetical protein AYI69_g6885 [Smittium culicis]|uniref:Uncharacterized protein n=1 Tax=Smittium culicis TaxID=133412 RepID=A0A1R1XVS6_9FUNG|nr:hypothetical protein AYI69_g6885 [Smittium culicis]
MFRDWGNTAELFDKNLTSKLYWLLAVTGFLRASDINRIDDSKTIIALGILNLAIVSPKEKRKGRPIIHHFQISRHIDQTLCPVYTDVVYKQRIAQTSCPTPHFNNSSIIVNRLLRYIKYHTKPLMLDRITRYLHLLSGLINRPPNTPIPKARAIGATLASSAGVLADDIVTHAFW